MVTAHSPYSGDTAGIEFLSCSRMER